MHFKGNPIPLYQMDTSPLMKSVNMQETKRSREISISHNKDRYIFTGTVDRTDLKGTHHKDIKEQMLELDYTESHVYTLMDKLQPGKNIQVQIDENWEEFTYVYWQKILENMFNESQFHVTK